jgi:hypothetical protein
MIGATAAIGRIAANRVAAAIATENDAEELDIAVDLTEISAVSHVIGTTR